MTCNISTAIANSVVSKISNVFTSSTRILLIWVHEVELAFVEALEDGGEAGVVYVVDEAAEAEAAHHIPTEDQDLTMRG